MTEQEYINVRYADIGQLTDAIEYTDHAAAIHELREALVGLCGAYAAMAGRQNRPLSPFYAKARATLDKYKGE